MTTDRDRVEVALRAYWGADDLDDTCSENWFREKRARIARALAAADALAPPVLGREAVARAVRGEMQQLGCLNKPCPAKDCMCKRIAAAVLALLPAAPPPTGLRRVRHVNRGTTYTVLGEAAMQIGSTGAMFRDYDKLVVYQGEDGRLWARFPEEMWDGRFEAIADAPAPAVPPPVRQHMDAALAALDRGHLNAVAGEIGRAIALLSIPPSEEVVREARCQFELGRHRIVALLTDLKGAFDAVAAIPTPPADTGDEAAARAAPAPLYTIDGLLAERDHYRRAYHQSVLKAQQRDTLARRVCELEEALRGALNAMQASLAALAVATSDSVPRLQERTKLVDAAIARARTIIGGGHE